MIRILFLFMIFCIIGWLWETPWVSLKTKKFVNRGFLHGPYIPIYGFAVITIILSMTIFEGVNQNNILMILIQVVYMAFVTAVWEYVTSWGLEKVFHTRWWDYSTYKFNLHGRICLLYSIFFGVGGYVLYRFVLPPFDLLYDQLTLSQSWVLLIGFYTVFTIDNIVTLRDLFQIRTVMIQLEKMSEKIQNELSILKQDIKANIGLKRDAFRNQLFEYRNDLEEYILSIDNSAFVLKTQKQLNDIKFKLANTHLMRFYRKYPRSSNKYILSAKKRLNNFFSKARK